MGQCSFWFVIWPCYQRLLKRAKEHYQSTFLDLSHSLCQKRALQWRTKLHVSCIFMLLITSSLSKQTFLVLDNFTSFDDGLHQSLSLGSWLQTIVPVGVIRWRFLMIILIALIKIIVPNNILIEIIWRQRKKMSPMLDNLFLIAHYV